MNNIQKRFVLFLVGCIGMRSLLVYLACIVNKVVLRYMGYVALLPAFGFLYLFLTGGRKRGVEVFGDKIWWNGLRPVHGVLYLLFAYNAINGNVDAWWYLLVDVLLALLAFLWFHYVSGNMGLLVDL